MADDKSWSSRWKTAKIFTYGFVAGLLCLRAVRLVQKFRLPRPAKIQTAVLPMLRANREVRHYVGSSLKPGLLSVHTYTGGIRWRYPRISRPFNLKQALPLYYQPWAVRMLFQVIGDNSTALVTFSWYRERRSMIHTDCGLQFWRRLVLKEHVDHSSCSSLWCVYELAGYRRFGVFSKDSCWAQGLSGSWSTCKTFC